MTDLSTTNLKRLLDQATPGPWRAEVGAAGVPEGWDEHWLALHMGHNSVYEVGYEPPEEEAYESFKLAAAAPDLAQEVLRMRRELTHMVEDLNSIHDNPEHSHMECLFALFAAMRLRSIIGHDNLGDHDD